MFLVTMEPPDDPTKKETCPGCGKQFKSVQTHITRSKTCDGGSPELLEKLKNAAVSKKKANIAIKRKIKTTTPAAKIRKLETAKKYRQSHKKEIQEYNKNYRQSNQKKIHEINKSYNQTHKQKIQEKKKNYKQSHKEEIQKYNKHHYQTNKSKKANSYKVSTKSLQNFFREIQRGPIFPCICCMRCLPLRSVSKLTDKFYQKLCEKDVAKYLCRESKLQIDGKWHLCSTCYSNLNQGNLPSQCQENGLQLATVPDCLKISDVGNQLLAKNLVFLKVSKNSIIISSNLTFTLNFR